MHLENAPWKSLKIALCAGKSLNFSANFIQPGFNLTNIMVFSPPENQYQVESPQEYFNCDNLMGWFALISFAECNNNWQQN